MLYRFAIAALARLVGVSCASTPFGLNNAADQPQERKTLHIAVQLQPDRLLVEHHSPTDSEAPGLVLAGIGGAMVGAALDNLTAIPSMLRAGRVERELDTDEMRSKLTTALEQAVDLAVSDSPVLQNWDVTVTQFDRSQGGAREYLASTERPDALVFLKGSFQLEGKLDRVRGIIVHDTYFLSPSSRSENPKLSWTRTLSALGDERPWQRRAFQPGEQEELISELREQIRFIMDRDGIKENAPQFGAIKKQIARLEKAKIAPDYVVLGEVWSGPETEEFLVGPAEQLSRLLNLVWEQEGRPVDFRDEAVRFRSRANKVSGESVGRRGYFVEQHNGGNIYWTFDDELVSIPTELAEQ